MRNILRLVIFIPLAVFVGVFAVENNQPLHLEIWPLAGVPPMWASVWILGLLAVGILFGLLIGWVAGAGWRRRARRAERLNRKLEDRLEDVDTQTAQADPQAGTGPPVTGAALPAPGDRAARATLLDD